ncbi:hypothetical protein EST38_g950 [Candolleomyces aberdarensis]|uniref:Cyclic-AMP phosphodiesterase n=1 Tax=Candolleomyces aberdarensis TaxID=2316362 RepID=A0A4Q2E0Q7_9AGAR|nr:hypothetical protein EST38_g950 [Candolleomyces aberdarensis]
MPNRLQGLVSLYKHCSSLCLVLVDYVALAVLNIHHESSRGRGSLPHAAITLPSSSPMTAFDIVVVGAGGGPDETNLSAYIVKSHSSCWEDGILALEAGSGQGALGRILETSPRLFLSEDDPLLPGRTLSAADVYSAIRCFLITHAHLDHINSLVVSAGSLKGPRKRIYAVKQTLQDIASVFNDRIWPNLASWDEKDEDYKLLYSPLTPDMTFTPIFPDISVQTFPLNHGSNDHGPYESSAYFIRHDLTGTEFLFFGDVEPDSLAATPRSVHVWRAAAPKIPETLRAVFIECSYPSGRPDSQLYGHLTPEYLLEELITLATEVRKLRPANHSAELHTKHTRKRQRRLPTVSDIRNALDGLTVYITHVKDAPTGKTPMREVILEQVRSLVESKGLGCTILAAEQGMHIRI